MPAPLLGHRNQTLVSSCAKRRISSDAFRWHASVLSLRSLCLTSRGILEWIECKVIPSEFLGARNLSSAFTFLLFHSFTFTLAFYARTIPGNLCALLSNPGKTGVKSFTPKCLVKIS